MRKLCDIADNGLTGTITSTEDAYQASFTNDRKVGDLTVTKTFSGIEALPEDFQITLEFTREFEVNAIYQEDITVVLTTGEDSDVTPTVNGSGIS